MSDDEIVEPKGDEPIELDDDVFDDAEAILEDGEGLGSVYGEEDDMESDFLTRDDIRDNSY